MPRGVTRESLDTCAGTVLTPPQSTVFANKKLVAVIDTPISPHGVAKHACAVMCTGSDDVFVENQKVCRENDSCDCGHSSTGSEDVFVNN